MKTLSKLSEARKNSFAAQIARRDAEIADLKAQVAREHARNNELRIENRKLLIRNSELDAAYTGLKEILRGRGVSVR